MTVQLSTMRVSAELDATKYVAGAQQKQAADRGMVATSREVSGAVSQTDTRLSQTGDSVSRLARQYVDGHANAMRFNAALNSLSAQLSRGNVEMTQALSILDGIYRKHGVVGDSARFAARGQTELAEAIERANARLLQQQNLSPANQNSPGALQYRRQNLGYQLLDTGQSLAGGASPVMVLAQQGPQVLQLYAGQGGINAALKDMGSLAAGAARALWPIGLAAAAGAVAISEMHDEIEKASGKSLSFGDVASKAIGVIVDDIKNLLLPAYTSIAPIAGYAFEKLGSAAVDIAELVINSFHAAYEDIKFLFDQFPNMIGAAVTGTVNAVVQGIADMIQRAAGMIDRFSAKANEWLPEKFQIGKIGDLRLGNVTVPNKYAEDLGAAVKDRNRRVDEIMQSQPLREYYRSVRDRVAGGLNEVELPMVGPVPAANPRRSLAGDDDAIKAMEKLSEQLEKLVTEMAFDREQLFRSPEDQQIASRLRGAGQAVDLTSPQAQYLRETMRMSETKDAINGFFSDFRQALVASGGNVGKAVGEALVNGLMNALTKSSEAAFDRLASIITKAIFGGGSDAASLNKSIGFTGANTTIGALLGAANDNSTFAAPVGAVSRAPLGDISVYAQAIKNIESSGNYGALGPLTRNGDRAYGAYQVMGSNIGPWSQAALGRTMTSAEFLSDPGAQDAIFRHRFGGYVDRYGSSGAAQAWFGGPGSVGKGGDGADVLGTTGNAYVAKFEANVGKLGNVAVSAARNVGGFADGVGKIGNALSAFPAAPVAAGGGGGGLLGWLGGLFRGGGGLSAATIAKFSPLTGLFADGTESAPGGLSMVGERGRELVRLPRGSQVIPNHRTESIVAANRNGRGRGERAAGGGQLTLVIQGASGDEHIRSLVKEGVAEGIDTLNKRMVTGAFGDMQRQYSWREA